MYLPFFIGREGINSSILLNPFYFCLLDQNKILVDSSEVSSIGLDQTSYTLSIESVNNISLKIFTLKKFELTDYSYKLTISSRYDLY